MAKVLITGTAGFIGFHLTRSLLQKGYQVVGLDNINDYYDVRLKYDRLKESGIDTNNLRSGYPNRSIGHNSNSKAYSFYKIDLSDRSSLNRLFEAERFDYVVNLAAQAGVRYSLTNPQAYIDANITGFLNILEACRAFPVKHLVYASSSSVYGKNTEMPFSVRHNVDHPVSLYAASKKGNELMAHTYSHLFGISATGLRFFTVYGPWGRPDMALFLFTKAILEGKPIEVFNEGNMMRDFTYIDDIVEGITRVMERPAVGNPSWDSRQPDPGSSDIAHRIYNIGRGKPVRLMDFIAALEQALGTTAEKILMPMQAGDVPATWADTKSLEADTGYKPQTSVEEGIKHFVSWYRGYYEK